MDNWTHKEILFKVFENWWLHIQLQTMPYMKGYIMRKKLFVITMLVAITACLSREPVDSEESVTGADIPAVDVWLTITDSIGVEMGDSDFVFGKPVAAFRMPAGRLAVLDMQECRVSIFSSDGELLGCLGGYGSGPGEFLLPFGLAITPTGGIVVSDAMSGRMEYYNSNMTYVHGNGGYYLSPPTNCVFLTDTTFIAMKPDYETEGTTINAGFVVALWNTASIEPQQVYYRYLKPFSPMDLSGSAKGIPLFAATADGNVYTSPVSTTEFTINGWNPDGSSLFVITEPFDMVQKSQEVIDREREYLQGVMNLGGAPDSMHDIFEPEAYYYAISTIGIGPDGNLWVGLGYHSRPVFRVYNPQNGQYEFTAALDCDRNLTVMMNRWGFAALEQLSDQWPRVFLLEQSSQ